MENQLQEHHSCGLLMLILSCTVHTPRMTNQQGLGTSGLVKPRLVTKLRLQNVLFGFPRTAVCSERRGCCCVSVWSLSTKVTPTSPQAEQIAGYKQHLRYESSKGCSEPSAVAQHQKTGEKPKKGCVETLRSCRCFATQRGLSDLLFNPYFPKFSAISWVKI